jgi:hypothetical protein
MTVLAGNVTLGQGLKMEFVELTTVQITKSSKWMDFAKHAQMMLHMPITKMDQETESVKEFLHAMTYQYMMLLITFAFLVANTRGNRLTTEVTNSVDLIHVISEASLWSMDHAKVALLINN